MIHELTIAKHEYLQNQTWKPHKGLNIICGKNGSGKTSLLQELVKQQGKVKHLLAPIQDFARIYNERISPLAQIETKEVAIQIGKFCEKEYPDAWKCLTFKID